MNGNNFAVKCVKNYGVFLTKDHVYTFVNGVTTFDNGGLSSYYSNMDDFFEGYAQGDCFVPYEESYAFPVEIKDSGNRREFETGAVRDIQEGKGRCDLMPLDVVAGFFTCEGKPCKVLQNLYEFTSTGETIWLGRTLDEFNEEVYKNNRAMILEVSKHFEAGAQKYGENNWQKGIPTHCYIDSAVRHYLKWLRGDKDEPHDRAFVWNLLCCIWTCEHKPELNDYGKAGEVNE